MDLEDKSTVDICQEKSANNTDEKTPAVARSEHFLSPTRRSSRIRKPQVSSDYCNLDEAIEANKIAPEESKDRELSTEKSACSIGTSSGVNFIDNNKDNELSHKSLEKNNLFFQMDSDEEESFESMFDDIFGQKYSKTLQSLLPKKLNSESVKERKFFKRNIIESPKSSFSKGYVSNKSDLPTDDVDKVFKIISKSNILSDIPSDAKISGKPSLKTYCNKRKNFNQNNIVESFGLPDYPIVSENVIKPVLNNKLDTEILDASEITILDLQFINEPWIARNMDDEIVFPFYEEIRIKEEPVKHERFRRNSSFLDYFENFDLCNDLNIYTSTPQNLVNDKILDKVKCASLNDTSTNKDIDIETRINFEKILNTKIDDDSPSNEETKEDVRVKVKRNISPKKKTGSVESKPNISISTEISFIETDILTVENKEFEISSNLPVPKRNENNSSNRYKCKNTSSKLVSSLGYSKTDRGYSNSPTNALATKKSKSIRRRLKASSISHSLKSQQQRTQEKMVKKKYLSVHQSSAYTAKKVLKSKTHKNEIAVKNEDAFKIDISVEKLPKKTVETDFVLFNSKHSLRSLLNNEEQCLEEQDKIVRCNEGNKLIPFKFHDTNNDNKKRTLRSSLNNSHDLQSTKTSTNLNEKTSTVSGNSELINTDADNRLCQERTEEELLNSIFKTQKEHLKTLKKSLGSNINLPCEQNLIKTMRNCKMIEQTEKKTNILPSKVIVTSKRILRSASQENLGKDVEEANTTAEENTESTVRNTSWNYLNGESKTKVKISLQKLKVETDINVPKNNRENGISVRKNYRKDKGPKSIKSIVKSDKREIHLQPEIVLRKCSKGANLPSNYNELHSEDENTEEMSPLKKGKKSVPEIRIIISPLDASFVSRASDITSDSYNKLEIMSPTKRKLRSTTALIDSMNKEKKSIDDAENEHGESPSKSKTVSQNIDPNEMLYKENSPKVVRNDVQMESINNTVLESDLNFLNELLSKDQEIDTSMGNKFEQVTLENEECIQENVPKVRTPRKSKGLSSIKTVSKDFDKTIRGDNCITVNNFKTIINNCNSSLFGDSANEQDESNFKGTKKDTLEFNKQRNSSLKDLQKQSASIISEIKTLKTTTLLRNAEADLNGCEITAALSKTENVICNHDGNNIDDKICQEFKCNRLQIKNVMDITSSKSIKMSNNVKIGIPKESKFLTENDTTIDGIEQKKELTKNAVSIGKQKNETVALESSLKLENTFTTDKHNKSIGIKNAEKESEIYKKEDSIRQLLQKGAIPKNEKWKTHLISNIAVKINPSNTNNCLVDIDEKKIQQEIPDLVQKELTKEKINSASSHVDAILNNVSLDLEVDSLNEIAGNAIEFNKLICTKSSVPIITNIETEELKLLMNSSNESLDSLRKINIIGTQLGVDDNAVHRGETEEQLIINNMAVSGENRNVKDISSIFEATITECDVEISPKSKDDCLELTEVFDKVITENREYENSLSIKNNNLPNTTESASNSLTEFDCETSEEKKQTDVIVTVSESNAATSICKDLLTNAENTKKGRNNKLINKSTENKRPKQKSLKKAENEHLLCAPQLKKEKSKSLAGKTSSSILEKSPKKTKNNCINEVIDLAKCSQFVDYLENGNVEKNISAQDITSNRISRRSTFNRKLTTENILSERENTKINGNDKCKSSKPSRRKRRKSINDLSDIEREQYRCRLRRSKSVAPSILESKKELYDRNDCKTMKKVDTCVDHVEIFDSGVKKHTDYKLKRSKSFSHGTLLSRSKNVDSGSIFNETFKKNGEKLIDKKKSRDIKGSMSKEANGKITTKEIKVFKDINREDEEIQFQVGDLAWAQIGSHPFWPCLVTEEPETVCHIKKMDFQGKRSQKIFYHVHFFGDNGRRAWINKQQMILYSNRNDLSELSDKIKIKNKSPLQQAYIIKPNKLIKWERAVNEAELLKTKSVDEKISFFIEMFAPRSKKKQKQLLLEDSATNEPLVNRKRKKKAVKNEEKLELSSNTDNTDEQSPVRKKFKKAVSTETAAAVSTETAAAVSAETASAVSTETASAVSTETASAVSTETAADNESISANISKNEIENDNLNKIENTEILQNENRLSSRLRLRKQLDEHSEIGSKTSSDNITDTTLYSMASQKALFKRNNLFKGVPRDKVCQYCYKPEAVLKCRGRCNGPYHIDCATKILQGKFYRRKKDRNTNISNLVHYTESVQKSKRILKEDKNTKETEVIDYPKHDINKFGLLEDDHVQIITVPSSVYNTPPRKTFPPNFKNMSLAEQIDYKMKEIMKKFESNTVYSESTDSSSEENSLIQPLSKVTNFPRCESLYPNNSTFDKESKITSIQELQENEITKIDHLADKPSTSPTVEKLIDNNNPNSKSENNRKPIVKSKHFIAHVTADFESLNSSKSDIIQEDNSDFTESVDIDNTVNPKKFKCGFCVSDLDPFCFICNLAVSKRGSSIRQKCSLYQCGRFYHPHCLKMWPQTQWSLIQTTKHKGSDEAVDSFVCPLHVCHTCASDDPRAATSRCSGDKIVKCLRCPSTYHSTNYCVPAGTTILSSTQIICPRHRERNKLYTINTTWCFLCSEGGNLICCETCPTSVHPECLPVNLTDDDKFICEDCESGRLPLYDEIVWVKLGKFRWWPGLILFPNEVPDNIMNIKHSTGEFVVKFFGTYDYYWVNRGRSFLFQEGDTGHCNSIKKKVDAAFNKAVEEAVVAHKSKKEFKRSQEAESISSLKPPPYIRIKVNKPVGNVRQLDLDLSSTNACECDPSQPNPCGPDSDCLNRLLLTECSPDVCPAGTRCKNQSFDKREYPPVVPYKTQGRGWGLKTLAPIKKGQFVIEYVGEMIDIEEYQRRIQKMHEQKEENYYFLTIDKDRMLDAGPKGNVARFMNHCCQPNCETQKWTVNGDTRVGLFANKDISTGTELTFNYNLECVGKEKKVCRCGAPNCSGFIGVKAKQDTDSKKPKKSYKKKKPEEPIILPPCFICGRKGKVGACNNKICNNAYHLKCLKMMEWPEGNKFICPWHNCNICSKRTIRCCVKCVNSFCPSHSEGNVRYDNLLGFVCINHDPIKIPNDEEPLKLRNKKNNEITEETAVTSTTSDDLEDKDSMPLAQRIVKNKRKKRKVAVESDSDNDFLVNKTLSSSTPFKKQVVYSDYESQDEGTVSSATISDVEENIIVKRKRGRPRKGERMKKQLKLNNVQSHESTASFSLLKDDSKLRNNSNNCELSISHNELENR